MHPVCCAIGIAGTDELTIRLGHTYHSGLARDDLQRHIESTAVRRKTGAEKHTWEQINHMDLESSLPKCRSAGGLTTHRSFAYCDSF